MLSTYPRQIALSIIECGVIQAKYMASRLLERTAKLQPRPFFQGPVPLTQYDRSVPQSSVSLTNA
jgi:hypothetical protein